MAAYSGNLLRWDKLGAALFTKQNRSRRDRLKALYYTSNFHGFRHTDMPYTYKYRLSQPCQALVYICSCGADPDHAHLYPSGYSAFRRRRQSMAQLRLYDHPAIRNTKACIHTDLCLPHSQGTGQAQSSPECASAVYTRCRSFGACCNTGRLRNSYSLPYDVFGNAIFRRHIHKIYNCCRDSSRTGSLHSLELCPPIGS